MNRCPECKSPISDEARKCSCGWILRHTGNGIKCRCGKFATVNMGMEWVCWDCRAVDLRGTHEEDWRDFELRQSAKKLGLGLKPGESVEELAQRAREMFRPLAAKLGDKYANDSTEQRTATS